LNGIEQKKDPSLTNLISCPSASPEYEGRGGSSLNLELGRMLERSLSLPSVLDLKYVLLDVNFI
jgi:hypothetical protein